MPALRVELQGALSGRHVVIDDDCLTMGVLEDMQSGQIGAILGAMAGCIVSGDLPGGNDHAGLRKLKPGEFKALADAFQAAVTVPKA